VSRSTLLLLIFDYALSGLRGDNRSIVRSASSLRGKLSIQPKHIVSFTTSLIAALLFVVFVREAARVDAFSRRFHPR